MLDTMSNRPRRQTGPVEPVIEAISKGAMESGGFGRIFVTEVADVVKIWTGERGPRAL